MKLKSLLLGLMLSVAAHAQWGIYGGSPDSANTWASTVAIADAAGRVFCSGVLVTKSKVLTAAHCVSGGALSYIKGGQVFFGVGGSKGWLKAISIAKFEAHPNYNGASDTEAYDFGVLSLKEDAPANVKIVPALSPAEGKVLFAQGKVALIQVGFGRREDGKSGEKYVTQSETTHIYDVEYEAGLNDGKGVCNGDSGGPTFAKISTGEFRVVGITSRGLVSNGTCLTRNQMFGRVDAAVEWYNKSNIVGHRIR